MKAKELNQYRKLLNKKISEYTILDKIKFARLQTKLNNCGLTQQEIDLIQK